MQIVQSSLTITGINSDNLKIYWNGVLIQNVTGVLVEWKNSKQRIRIRCSILDSNLVSELAAANITMKYGV